MLILLLAASMSFCSFLFGSLIFLKNHWGQKVTINKLTYVTPNIILYLTLGLLNLAGLICLLREGVCQTIALLFLPLSQVSAINLHILVPNFTSSFYHKRVKTKRTHFWLMILLQLAISLGILLVQICTYSLRKSEFEKASKEVYVALTLLQVLYIVVMIISITVETKSNTRKRTENSKYDFNELDKNINLYSTLKQYDFFFIYCIQVIGNCIIAFSLKLNEQVNMLILKIVVISLCFCSYVNMYISNRYLDKTNKILLKRINLKEKLADLEFIKESHDTLKNFNLEHVEISMKYYHEHEMYKTNLKNNIKNIHEIAKNVSDSKLDPFMNICGSKSLNKNELLHFKVTLESFIKLIEKFEGDLVQTTLDFDRIGNKDNYITEIREILRTNRKVYKEDVLEFKSVVYKETKYLNDRYKILDADECEENDTYDFIYMEDYKSKNRKEKHRKRWKHLYLMFYNILLKYIREINRGILRVLEEDRYIDNFIVNN